LAGSIKEYEVKKLVFLAISFALASVLSAADFPINNVRVQISKLEVWPSREGAGRYNAWVSTPLTIAGCPNTTGFTIEDGPGAEAAYSTLLAAVLSGKDVELYLTRCEYFVIADRVRIIP
jgi:hypothetical protein